MDALARAFVVAGSPAARRPVEYRAEAGRFRRCCRLRRAGIASSWGWPVNLLVGDLDSLPAEDAARAAAAGVETVRSPAAKDETDTELALAARAGSPARARSSFARRWAGARTTCWRTCCCWRGDRSRRSTCASSTAARPCASPAGDPGAVARLTIDGAARRSRVAAAPWRRRGGRSRPRVCCTRSHDETLVPRRGPGCQQRNARCPRGASASRAADCLSFRTGWKSR